MITHLLELLARNVSHLTIGILKTKDELIMFCLRISLPPANVVCEGYVFTGVCLSMGGGKENPWQGDPPGKETPWQGDPPWQGEPLGKEPPWQGAPLARRPPSKETPLTRGPPGKETPARRPPLARGPPGKETPWQGDPPTGRPQAGRPPGKETPLSMCGQYASYWNAFLLCILFREC